MGVTDMKHAIQYALTFPKRQPGSLPPLDFAKLSQLTFEEPDLDKFPCLALAYKALRTGGTMPATLNAANEIAVQAFLDGKIRLSEIPEVIESVMDEHEVKPVTSLEIILECDDQARRQTLRKLSAFENVNSTAQTKFADIIP
jgi:1-deoxy-D-xylulose-5-phosphate reductoisomerase